MPSNRQKHPEGVSQFLQPRGCRESVSLMSAKGEEEESSDVSSHTSDDDTTTEDSEDNSEEEDVGVSVQF